MRDTFGVGTALVVVGAMLVLPGAAVAAKKDPVVACAAFKLKNTGGAASAMLACHALGAQKGRAVDPECVEAVSGKLAEGFAKAEDAAQKADALCPERGEIADVEDELATFVTGVVAALRASGDTPSKCVAKKLALVGKHAQRLLGAHAAQRSKPDPVKFADKIAAASAAILKAFGKLDEKGKDCQTSGDGNAMSKVAEDLVVAQVCEDRDLCTTDAVAGTVCQNTPVTCAENHACDFRSGSCEYAHCCLFGAAGGLCVVEIPVAQIPTSATYCQGVDAAQGGLSLLNFGPQCIGWRATGADDCF